MSGITDFIDSEVKANDVVLFMKGTPGFPQCGFSGQVVQILDYIGVDYKGVDVLTSGELRQGIKEYSNWPTIPQLYVKGEFVGGCDIVREMFQAGVALRVGAHVPLVEVGSDRVRFAALLLDRGQVLLLELLEFLGRKRRLAQDLGGEPEDGRKVLADGLDRQRRLGGAPAHAHPGFQPVELVLDLLARVLGGTAHQHVGREIRGGGLAHQALLVAESQGQGRHDGAAPRLLRQQRDLGSVGQLRALRAGLDVGRDASNASPGLTTASPL